MTKSWRDVLPIHEAADALPLMSPDELRALADDIKKNGLLHAVDIFFDDAGKQYLIDGRNRLDALELLGHELVTAHGQLVQTYCGDVAIDVPAENVTAWVISKNIRRRHLNQEQKRELAAKLLKLDPTKSNRQVAKVVGLHHETLAVVRKRGEACGEIRHVEKAKDTTGREQPIRKPKPAEVPEGPLHSRHRGPGKRRTKSEPRASWAFCTRTLERQVIKPGSVIPKPFKVGGKRMWRRQDLEAFLAASALLARARGHDHE